MRLRHWVYGLAATPAFTRLDGTDLWYLVLDAARATRASNTRSRSSAATTWSRSRIRSTRTTPATRSAPTRCSQTDGLRRGRRGRCPTPRRAPAPLVAHRSHSPALGRDVDVSLYLPARFRPTGRYPLLVVHDGGDYLDYSSMQVVLDNLIHRLEIAEIVVAFSQPAGSAGRVRRRRATRPLPRRRARAVARDRVPARRRSPADAA